MRSHFIEKGRVITFEVKHKSMRPLEKRFHRVQPILAKIQGQFRGTRQITEGQHAKLALRWNPRKCSTSARLQLFTNHSIIKKACSETNNTNEQCLTCFRNFYHEDPPLTNPDPRTFHQSKTLSAELQHRIWTYAVDATPPRVVNLIYDGGSYELGSNNTRK
jgi:hypothetical protein